VLSHRLEEDQVGGKTECLRTDKTTVVLKIGAPKQPEIAIAVLEPVPLASSPSDFSIAARSRRASKKAANPSGTQLPQASAVRPIIVSGTFRKKPTDSSNATASSASRSIHARHAKNDVMQ